MSEDPYWGSGFTYCVRCGVGDNDPEVDIRKETTEDGEPYTVCDVCEPVGG
jgi:hypothetical protein